jgi:hypothetical protein
MSSSAPSLAARAVVPGIAGLAAFSLGLGTWQVLAPRSFYDALGPFGPLNDHYVRDYAAWSLAYGAALLVALRRPSWRAPLLALGLLQFALHTVNHLVDAGDADPVWVGVLDVVLLALTAGGLVLLVRASAARDGAR